MRLGLLFTAGLTMIFSLSQGGEVCGSRSSMFNRFSNAYIVPDFWPPEKASFTTFAVIGQTCRVYGNARLYHGCERHDACYAETATTQQTCDSRILNDWLNACKSAYDASLYEYLYTIGELKSLCEVQCRADVYQMATVLGIFGADAKQSAESKSKGDATKVAISAGYQLLLK